MLYSFIYHIEISVQNICLQTYDTKSVLWEAQENIEMV